MIVHLVTERSRQQRCEISLSCAVREYDIYGMADESAACAGWNTAGI